MKRKPLASFSFATPLSKKMKESKSQSRLKQSTCVPRPDYSPLLFLHSLLIWGWRFHLEAQNAQTKDYFNLEQITHPSFSLTLCRVPLLSFPSRLWPFQGAEELILMMMELMMIVVLPTIVMMMMMISSKEPRSTNWRSSRQLFRKVEMSRALFALLSISNSIVQVWKRTY